MLAVALAAMWLAPPALPPRQQPLVPAEPEAPPAPEPTPTPPTPDVAENSLVWNAPPSCPDASTVEARTEELLGRALSPGELDLLGTIEQTPQGYVLTLRTTSSQGEQTDRLEAERCETLAEAAALIAAVLIDPAAAMSTVDPNSSAPSVVEPSTEPPPDPAASVRVAADETPAQSPAQREPPRTRTVLGWARLRAGGEFGAVPRGTGGFDGSFAVGTARLRGELVGAYWVGREVRRGGGVATVSLGHATTRVCGLVLPGKVQIPLCAGVELGAMRADAREVVAAETRRGLWVAAHAAAGVRWSFRPRVSLWAEAQLFVPVVFPRFELVDPDDASLTSEVYTPNVAGPRGLVGIEYKLF